MKRSIKLVAVLVSLMMILTGLTACSSSKKEESASAIETIKTEEKLELVYLVINHLLVM